MMGRIVPAVDVLDSSKNERTSTSLSALANTKSTGELSVSDGTLLEMGISDQKRLQDVVPPPTKHTTVFIKERMTS